MVLKLIKESVYIFFKQFLILYDFSESRNLSINITLGSMTSLIS